MSLRKVEARLIADEDTTGDVRAVEVFGHVLTEEFREIEVDDHVLAKLQGNPHIDVVGGDEDEEGNPFDHDGDGKSGGSRPRKASKPRASKPKEAPEPEASPDADDGEPEQSKH